MNTQLKNRILSFIWRAGDVAVVAILGYVASNLGLFNLPTQWTVIIGLVLGEVTKYFNSEAQKPIS
jgi:hypothetical protein